MKSLISATVLALLCAAPVYAADCANDHPEDYEAGVSDGRDDGSDGKSQKPTRHREQDNKHKNRWTCYTRGYEIGYANASADRSRDRGLSQDMGGKPREGSNERAYYDDGCERGRQDGKAGMSSFYGRYSEDYDRRFESYFASGYEACWRKYR